MTPKEKAEELFEKIQNVDDYTAKQCVLIAVDEIIKELSAYADYFDCTDTFEKSEYWLCVKNEIINL